VQDENEMTKGEARHEYESPWTSSCFFSSPAQHVSE